MQQPDVILIGKIDKLRAAKGYFQISLTELPYECFSGKSVFIEIDGLKVPFTITEAEGNGRLMLAKFKENDFDRIYSGCDVYCLKQDVDCEKGNAVKNFAQILKGYTISDSRQGLAGSISNIDTSTPNVVATVESPQGSMLVPITDAFIESIDNERKIVSMHLPDGIMDINDTSKIRKKRK